MKLIRRMYQALGVKDIDAILPVPNSSRQPLDPGTGELADVTFR
jgi:hypothetical protein